MASAASTSLGISISVHRSHSKPLFAVSRTHFILPRQPSRTFICFSRRRSRPHSPIATSKKRNKQNLPRQTAEEDDNELDEDLDEDAFEALFTQLEEDLKNDGLSVNDGNNDLSEEDLAKLENELMEALEYDEQLGGLGSSADGNFEEAEEDDEKDDDEDNDDYDNEDDNEEQRPLRLKNWQLRRLAYALKMGRRKTGIKSLATELCLDREVVLGLLRDPPPNLLMMSAILPEPVSKILEPARKPDETVPPEMTTDASVPETEGNVPVHVMQQSWSARKRLKKVQLETLERVYKRTKWPTNAMVSSIVHVTNLPRKRVVKWFEDKRIEDGVPTHRLPYRRSSP